MFCDGGATQSKMILVLRAFKMASDEIDDSTEDLVDQPLVFEVTARDLPKGQLGISMMLKRRLWRLVLPRRI